MSSSAPLDERRTVIIHAVWQVLAEGGMGAVSIRNVATAAGISIGGVQYWFRNKDELVRASLESMLSSAAQLHAAAAEEADDREALWHLLAHPIPRAQAGRAGVSAFHHFVAAAIAHPMLAGMLAEAKDREEDEAVRLLSRIAPDLDDPRAAGRSLIASADGLTIRVLIGSLSAAQADQALRADLNRWIGPDTVAPSPGG